MLETCCIGTSPELERGVERGVERVAVVAAALDRSQAAREVSEVNTLAVNRLLRRLEATIAGGQHQEAARLARDLARLKISCCVTRQRAAPLRDTIT